MLGTSNDTLTLPLRAGTLGAIWRITVLAVDTPPTAAADELFTF